MSRIGQITMKRMRSIEFGIIVGVVIIGIVVWISAASAERSRLTPPSTATTLEKFAECMPPPQHLAIIDVDGVSKFIWIGEVAKWSLPSGPGCYVFDSDGSLVQWDLETGDGQKSTRFLHPAWQAKSIRVDEALVLIAKEH